METVNKLREYEDGSYLAFDTGNFDDYRVTFYHNGSQHSPKDTWFFDKLVAIKRKPHTVWLVVQQIAKQINKTTEFQNIVFPDRIESQEAKKVFDFMAAAMIAEERKKGTVLGKRVKLLGIYQILFVYKNALVASWSKDKPAGIISDECEGYGF